MNLAGIIVEYNPMHNGHIHHIQKTRELTKCDGLIAVMSGNFNQRGIPSLIDKYEKTNMALHNGVDLVLELPTIYALSSAEFFSYGALTLLNNLNVVNSLCFGSEHGNIDTLKVISKILYDEPIEFKGYLKEKLKEGELYPKARTYAIKKYLNEKDIFISNLEDILNSSNNILAIEYLKSIIKLDSTIIPYTIKREGGSYNSSDFNATFSSATSIRNHLKSTDSLDELVNHIPSYNFKRLNELDSLGYNFTFEDSMLPYIKYKNYSKFNLLNKIPDVSEGLHNKIEKSINNLYNYNDILLDIKSKRYALTRISRILCQFFIGFEDFNCDHLRKEPASYAKVLGFNDKGKNILKSIKTNSDFPIYTKVPRIQNESLKLDLQASKMYSLLNKNYKYNEDFLRGPIIIK
ncbi:nucleotidyltransferase [Clostridium sp. CTA-19]